MSAAEVAPNCITGTIYAIRTKAFYLRWQWKLRSLPSSNGREPGAGNTDLVLEPNPAFDCGLETYFTAEEEDASPSVDAAGHEPGEGETGLILGASIPNPIPADGSMSFKEDLTAEEGHVVLS
jgi:hypothetical protein